MRIGRRLLLGMMCVALAPRVYAAPPKVTRDGGVTVARAETVVQRKRFDPGNPPPEMPPLGPHADAVTESRFGCAASVQYSIVSRQREGRAGPGGCTASARVESVRVDIDLAVTIWLPNRASPKLVAHEEGHRTIAEKIYDEAATAAAKAEARKLLGRTFTARGASCEAAVEAAIKEANDRLTHAYLDATSAWSTRVGNRYDEISDHGKRSDPPIEEAIRQSFEREPQFPDAEATRGAGGPPR